MIKQLIQEHSDQNDIMFWYRNMFGFPTEMFWETKASKVIFSC